MSTRLPIGAPAAAHAVNRRTAASARCIISVYVPAMSSDWGRFCLGLLRRRSARGGRLHDSNRPQPRFHQPRPLRDRQLARAKAEGVIALRVQVHFRGDAGFLQRDVVGERLLHAVHVMGGVRRKVKVTKSADPTES